MLVIAKLNYTKLFNSRTRLLIIAITASVVAMLVLLPCISLAADEPQGRLPLRIKDYGIHGHLFKIAEPSIIEEIMEKLQAAKADGTLEQLQSKFVKKVKEKVLRPVPVANISKAQVDRSWTYDPTYRQHTNITDGQGRIIVAAGTSVNALTKLKWGDPLILIDGDDQQQVEWIKGKHGKVVLTNGTPLALAEILKRPVYFDQGGIICKKFNIKAVPAIIQQDALLLRINEVAI